MVIEPILTPKPIVIPEDRRLKNNYHMDFSPKRGEYVEFDGPLEYNFWVLKESHPNVIQLCPQPLKIYERIDGRILDYTFDLWTLEEDQGEILWDVKEKKKLVEDVNGNMVPAKWPQVCKWSENRSPVIRFVTEDHISDSSTALRITNWKEMLRFIGPASPRITKKEEEAVLERLAREPQSIGNILRALYRLDESKVKTAIVRLLHQGNLLSDVDSRPFNGNTLLQVPNA